MEYTREQIIELKKEIISKDTYNIEDFRNIIRILMSKDEGCPWDSVQTHESIINCLIEESYEVVQAIKDKDDENLKEELGDVLMQIVMHSEMGASEELFTFEEVVDGISKKMVNRHPRVFKDTLSENSNDSWESVKAKEKEGTREARKGVLRRIPESLPALIRTQKVIEKNEKANGEVISAKDSIDILKNNIKMLENIDFEDCKYNNINKIIGESLLHLTNIALKTQENAENSLTKVVEEFINRREG